MTPQVSFYASIVFSFIAWSVLAARYIWPRLRQCEREEALRPLLMLHSFRFVGLAFLVPGVVSPGLPAIFAQSAAYGDVVAAALALLSLALLRSAAGVAMAWLFNLWGSADLFHAFFEANRSGLAPGQLGATYFVPTLVVPLLLITHAIAFRILLRNRSTSIETEAAPMTGTVRR